MPSSNLLTLIFKATAILAIEVKVGLRTPLSIPLM